MQLIFLHGPPAVGKLTVGRELATLTGWPLFHNHLAVDLALAVFPFGSPGFVAVREEVWWTVFRRALADGLPGLIFTFNPENSVPQTFIDALFAELSAGGAEVIPVALTVAEAEIERRLTDTSRHSRRKLVDLDLYRRLREAGTFATPRIPAARLTLDTGALSPPAAAREIARALHLPGAFTGP
jgi:hypothetical protein